KNVNDNVLEIPGVQLVHLDQLSQMTDDTLEKRKQYVPQAMQIIEEIKEEFITWTQARKFAPTIHALKAKLEEIKEIEIRYQKITTHFANHLKDESTEVNESIEWIEKVFQLETLYNE